MLVLWNSKRFPIGHDEYQPLQKFLLKILSLTAGGFQDFLANDEARKLMVAANPAEHPILKDPFWNKDGGEWDEDAINKYWADKCSLCSLQHCENANLYAKPPVLKPLCENPVPSSSAEPTKQEKHQLGNSEQTRMSGTHVSSARLMLLSAPIIYFILFSM